MDEENYYEYDPYERSDDYNVFEENCIFEDREGQEEEEEFLDPQDHIEYEPMEDFGFFGEAGLWD